MTSSERVLHVLQIRPALSGLQTHLSFTRKEPGLRLHLENISIEQSQVRRKHQLRFLFVMETLSGNQRQFVYPKSYFEKFRYFVCRALQFDPRGWLRMAVHNGSITVLVIKPSGRVSLLELGGAGHFPPEMLTFN